MQKTFKSSQQVFVNYSVVVIAVMIFSSSYSFRGQIWPILFVRMKYKNTSTCYLAEIKAGPMWAPFTALKYEELGLLISAREVDLPISLRLTDSVKHFYYYGVNFYYYGG